MKIILFCKYYLPNNELITYLRRNQTKTSQPSIFVLIIESSVAVAQHFKIKTSSGCEDSSVTVIKNYIYLLRTTLKYLFNNQKLTIFHLVSNLLQQPPIFTDNSLAIAYKNIRNISNATVDLHNNNNSVLTNLKLGFAHLMRSTILSIELMKRW